MKQTLPMFCLMVVINLANAQDVNTQTQRKNTVKLDLTSYYLYRNALGLSFERVITPHQTLAISGGYQEFPRTGNFGQAIGVREDRQRSGYKIGAEYRFYLKKENKYLAPRGLYIGPYLAYHSFKNERIIEVDNDGTLEQAILNSKLSIFNVGFQLGYQFVIKNRFTIDLVLIGPSISNYKYKLTLGGNYTFDKEDIQDQIILALIDRFPLLDEVISDKEATRDGNLNAWAYGYRYQLLLGYHFGRKKK